MPYINCFTVLFVLIIMVSGHLISFEVMCHLLQFPKEPAPAIAKAWLSGSSGLNDRASINRHRLDSSLKFEREEKRKLHIVKVKRNCPQNHEPQDGVCKSESSL